MREDYCECGHSKFNHIYLTGPCRPGFICECHCAGFKAKHTDERGGIGQSQPPQDKDRAQLERDELIEEIADYVCRRIIGVEAFYKSDFKRFLKSKLK